MFDLLIKNAKVVDGTSSPWYIADVAVKDGKIAKIGKICESESIKTVDAKHNILAPGFIDIHSHSDFGILKHNLNESRVLQGITTELGGDCGLSPIPVNPENVDLLKKYVEFLEKDIDFCWTDAGGFFDKIEKAGTSVNFAMTVGHGSIRLAVMGFDDSRPTFDELEKMRILAAQSMEQGCFGLSTGLIYPPGSFAENDEIIELAKVVASYGGFYKSHMRWQEERILESVEDTIDVALKAELPVQIVHIKAKGRKNWKYKAHAVTALIARARENGLDISADQYPYCASSSTLTMVIPQWALVGGTVKMLERLKDSETRKEIAETIRKESAESLSSWSDYFVASINGEKNAWVKGKSIAEIAEQLDKDPVEALIDLLIEEDGNISQISFAVCEDDLEHFMRQPFVMIGSDGWTIPLNTKNIPHPRSFGSFPRVIAKYCRERKLFSLETAINKMTGMPAARIGLADRGVIKAGMWADLVLFDFDKIYDTPTFTKPAAACEGILQVYINGVLTAENGVHTGAAAGKVLRRGH